MEIAVGLSQNTLLSTMSVQLSNSATATPLVVLEFFHNTDRVTRVRSHRFRFRPALRLFSMRQPFNSQPIVWKASIPIWALRMVRSFSRTLTAYGMENTQGVAKEGAT